MGQVRDLEFGSNGVMIMLRLPPRRRSPRRVPRGSRGVVGRGRGRGGRDMRLASCHHGVGRRAVWIAGLAGCRRGRAWARGSTKVYCPWQARHQPEERRAALGLGRVSCVLLN